MQAASTVRGTGISRSAAGFVIGLMAALLIGGFGGFAAKSLSGGQSAVTTHTVAMPHQQAPDAIDRNAQLSEGGPSSDLTRALPTAAPVQNAGRGRRLNAGLNPGL